jgi:hypothetical protein
MVFCSWCTFSPQKFDHCTVLFFGATASEADTWTSLSQHNNWLFKIQTATWGLSVPILIVVYTISSTANKIRKFMKHWILSDSPTYFIIQFEETTARCCQIWTFFDNTNTHHWRPFRLDSESTTCMLLCVTLTSHLAASVYQNNNSEHKTMKCEIS